MPSSSDPSTSTTTAPVAAAPVAPLALSTVRARYPRLFAMYATLSEREEGTQDALGNNAKTLHVDPATGLYTTIFFQNFTETLDRNPDDVPLLTESEGNKYFHLVYRMLLACESGSCGGDACRLFETLYAALGGAIEYSDSNDYTLFEHLLGWTVAANNHQLFHLWDHAEPYRTQCLFDWAAKEWKRLFEKTVVSGAIPGVSDEMRNFAILICGQFKKLVVGARKEWGDHAKYSFNFIKPKSRPPKKPVKKKPKRVVERPAKKAKKSNTTDLQVDVGTSTATDSAAPARVTPPAYIFNDHFITVCVTVHKPDKQTKLGLGLKDITSDNIGSFTMQVSSISESGLFHNTELRVGMWIQLINGLANFSFSSGLASLQNSSGDLTIYALCPREKDSTKPNSTAAAVDSSTTISTAGVSSVAFDAASDTLVCEQNMPSSSNESKYGMVKGADVPGDTIAAASTM